MSVLRSRILRSAAAGGGARAITLLVGLFITPYLIVRLGSERFGIWALATLVGGAYGMLDLGLRTGILRFLAESESLGDQRESERIVATCVTVYLGLTVATLALYVVARDALLRLLAIPEELQSLAGTIFLIALLGAGLGSILTVFPAQFDVRQRMEVTNGLGVVCLLLNAVLTVLVVENGYGLVGVALAQLFSILAFYAAAAWSSRRWWSARALSPRSFSRATLGRLLRHGIQLYVSSICGIVNRQFDKLLLSRYFGLTSVTSYELAARLTTNAGSFQGHLMAPLLPASSHLTSRKEPARLRRLYLEASRYSFFVGVPPFFLLALFSDEVVTAWLGRPDARAAGTLLILAGGYLLNSLSHAMAATCQGIGRPGIQAEQSLVQLVSNVVLSIGLLRQFGAWGPPLGTSLALAFGALYFALRFHPRIGVTNREMLVTRLLPPILVASAATAATFAVGRPWNLEPAADRLEALSRLVLGTGVFGVLYLVGCGLARYVTLSDLWRLREGLVRVPDEELAT